MLELGKKRCCYCCGKHRCSRCQCFVTLAILAALGLAGGLLLVYVIAPGSSKVVPVAFADRRLFASSTTLPTAATTNEHWHLTMSTLKCTCVASASTFFYFAVIAKNALGDAVISFDTVVLTQPTNSSLQMSVYGMIDNPSFLSATMQPSKLDLLYEDVAVVSGRNLSPILAWCVFRPMTRFCNFSIWKPASPKEEFRFEVNF